MAQDGNTILRVIHCPLIAGMPIQTLFAPHNMKTPTSSLYCGSNRRRSRGHGSRRILIAVEGNMITLSWTPEIWFKISLTDSTNPYTPCCQSRGCEGRPVLHASLCSSTSRCRSVPKTWILWSNRRQGTISKYHSWWISRTTSSRNRFTKGLIT